MALDLKRIKLFWLVFYGICICYGWRICPNLVSEVIVSCVPRSSGGQKQISAMAKLVLYDPWCGLFQLHFSDDAIMPAHI